MATDKQRRQAEQRRLRRQAERRRQQAARRRRLNIIASVVGTVLVIGVVVTLIVTTRGSDSSPDAGSSGTPTRSGTPTTSAPASTASSTTAPASPASRTSGSAATTTRAGNAATVSCSYPRSGTAAKAVTVPPTKASARGTAVVRLTTSQGPLTFTLNRAEAPCTVNSFLSLAKQKYYDGTRCHRLVTKGLFVLQCGDPTATGSGGPGYSYADELTGKEKYTRGVLAMANAGPNTNGSQFFIVDKDTQLGPSYTVFGTVTAGLAVVDKVAAAGTSDGSTDGPPKLPLVFTSVTAT